ncbi:hypothetical protein BABINDRAFT_161066 [Babjeviella inositovora NRRL Y-12698]|uniref:Elongator complex protein 6 n=1 Tax=Babjeviella inositovora NRRL Y-12698 TaxID=984486 RepID=A0A1E3QT30_9ASCO|nr:uncharacterized protein BABINDRAFT_161066 [Babjeviella inositovora NRRL Y-12698]ODQ80873.1 hypothetical protein BABINDRAFT_161066 [Babjeviella inositovora NRRL Y-12698]
MSASQRQDLAIYSNGCIIPPLNPAFKSLNLVTYQQGTHHTWLTQALLENALLDTCSLNSDSSQTARSLNNSRNLEDAKAHVVVVSFMNDLAHWSKNLKKCNNLDVTPSSPNFTFLDCFTNLFSKFITAPTSAQSIEAQVQELFADVTQKIVTAVRAKPAHQRLIVVVENLEFLIAATCLRANQLLCQVSALQNIASHLYVVTQLAPEAIDVSTVASSAHNPVYKATDFLVKMIYRAHLVLQVQPLATGRADDVTGVLRIVRGGLSEEMRLVTGLNVVEKEYLYLVNKDGNAKLFFR